MKFTSKDVSVSDYIKSSHEGNQCRVLDIVKILQPAYLHLRHHK